jgi:hypothetical protein
MEDQWRGTTGTSTEDSCWDSIPETDDVSVCPNSPMILIAENGKKIRMFPYWQWKSKVDDFQFVPIKKAFECRDEAKLLGTYSSGENEDNSTVESMKKGSGLIQKFEFIFDLEDMPTSELNLTDEESLVLQMRELEIIEKEQELNSMQLRMICLP